MKELLIILFSSFKFAMTFPLAILEYKMGIMKTLIWTNIGGLLGILFFSFLSEQVILFWKNYVTRFFAKKIKPEASAVPRKKIFTRRNRRIVHIKSKYGLPGIALATPILLSIPVGTFLVERYFEKKSLKLTYLAGSNFIWSMIYVFFYTFCYDLYLEWFVN